MATTPVRKVKPVGVIGALSNAIKSMANVVTDIGNAGSLASEGLLMSAEQFRLDSFQGLLDEFGDVDTLTELQSQATDFCTAIRNRR